MMSRISSSPFRFRCRSSTIGVTLAQTRAGFTYGSGKSERIGVTPAGARKSGSLNGDPSSFSTRRSRPES